MRARGEPGRDVVSLEGSFLVLTAMGWSENSHTQAHLCCSLLLAARCCLLLAAACCSLLAATAAAAAAAAPDRGGGGSGGGGDGRGGCADDAAILGHSLPRQQIRVAARSESSVVSRW